MIIKLQLMNTQSSGFLFLLCHRIGQINIFSNTLPSSHVLYHSLSLSLLLFTAPGRASPKPDGIRVVTEAVVLAARLYIRVGSGGQLWLTYFAWDQEASGLNLSSGGRGKGVGEIEEGLFPLFFCSALFFGI